MRPSRAPMFKSGAMKPPTTMKREDPKFPPTKHYVVLADLIKSNDWRRGAEIGVLKGKCLFYLLDSYSRLSMVAVDSWQYREPSMEEGAENYRRHDLERCAREVRSKAIKHYPGRCVIYRSDQAKAAEYIADRSLDFAFLDADHREQPTKDTINCWLPKIKIGGSLLGHDISWPSVKRAVDELLPGWEDLGEQVWSFKVLHEGQIGNGVSDT